MNIGAPEAIIALVIILVLFGGSQLPKLAKNLGKAQKEFKEGLAEGQAETHAAGSTAAPTPAAPVVEQPKPNE
jgi:sec-independent protein translocase protein TatA